MSLQVYLNYNITLQQPKLIFSTDEFMWGFSPSIAITFHQLHRDNEFSDRSRLSIDGSDLRMKKVDIDDVTERSDCTYCSEPLKEKKIIFYKRPLRNSPTIDLHYGCLCHFVTELEEFMITHSSFYTALAI